METEFGGPIQVRFFDRRLSGVGRYGLTHLNNPKSVAEHTYEVDRNAAWICLLLKEAGIDVDELEVAWEARVHDEEEEISSDWPHTVKHGKGTTSEEAVVIDRAFSIIATNAIAFLYSEMPEPIRKRSIEAWHRYKDRDTIEAQVVKLADILSGLAECAEERRIGNSLIEKDEKRYLRLYDDFKREYEWVGKIVEYLPA